MVSESRCLLFADDLKMFRVIESQNDAQLLQRDVDSVCMWSRVNGLELNVSKCHSITFCRSLNVIVNQYRIDDTVISAVTNIKDLGVYFDSKLTFVTHFVEIVSRAMRNLGFIMRNSNQLTPHCFRLLCISLVRSGVEYASVIWSPYYTCHIDDIEAVQKRFLRSLASRANINIYNGYQINYDIISNAFSIDSLQNRRFHADIFALYKILNGFYYCPDLLHGIQFNVNYRNCGNSMFRIPYSHANYGMYSPLNRMFRAYNQLKLDPFVGNFRTFKSYVLKLKVPGQ